MSRFDKLKDATCLSELANVLGFKPKGVSYILYEIPEKDKYKEFEIPKKGGSTRKINAPNDKLKHLQTRLADLLNFCFDEIFINDHQIKSVSHGFRKEHSFITNAKKHQNKRHVFNIDLQDFFPSINFGRVRGFFIKNHHFNLNPKVATVIAQIACYNNVLPQGSPCSPVISNFIGHLLDIRMVNLAKRTKCTYSRYADDLTFSTNKRDFSEKIAKKNNENYWIAGDSLKKEVEKVGFLINPNKTSMQYKSTRQMTTGLIVNKKINIRKEYYKKARSMCYELFHSDEFYIDKEHLDKSGSSKRVEGTLNQLEGILSFIYQIKLAHTSTDSSNNKPLAIKEMYRKFLYYKYFFSISKPLIMCEGKTDIIYLKCALKQLGNEYPELVHITEDSSELKIGFFKMSKNLSNILDVSQGTAGLSKIMEKYNEYIKTFGGNGKKHPVIMVIDNDKGNHAIKSLIKQKLKIQKVESNNYYKFVENLYIMFISDEDDKAIESLFDKEILSTKLNGKTFGYKKINPEKEYGKFLFADQIIKPKQNEINFNGFKPVFEKFQKILLDYSKTIHNNSEE